MVLLLAVPASWGGPASPGQGRCQVSAPCLAPTEKRSINVASPTSRAASQAACTCHPDAQPPPKRHARGARRTWPARAPQGREGPLISAVNLVRMDRRRQQPTPGLRVTSARGSPSPARLPAENPKPTGTTEPPASPRTHACRACSDPGGQGQPQGLRHPSSQSSPPGHCSTWESGSPQPLASPLPSADQRHLPPEGAARPLTHPAQGSRPPQPLTPSCTPAGPAWESSLGEGALYGPQQAGASWFGDCEHSVAPLPSWRQAPHVAPQIGQDARMTHGA